MSAAEIPSVDPTAELTRAFDLQRAAFRRNPQPSYAERKENLLRLRRMMVESAPRFGEAIHTDFGCRSKVETLAAEVFLVVGAIDYTLKHLKSWMKPQKRHTHLLFAPASNAVLLQPKGVVGIMSPWNYPAQLALLPLVTALAAGNRAIIKPSELTPVTAALLQELLSETFEEDLVSVVNGEMELAQAFSATPFDHLFFTGSTAVGRIVMKAAAENLTPVTLELGGKSPVVVHKDHPVDHAAERVVYGKLLNAGQTCIAPDYVLVHSSQVEAFSAALQRQIAKLYPTLVANDNYTAIVNERHHARLLKLKSDAEAKGATLVEVNPAGESFEGAGTKLCPTLVLNPTEDMAILQEEIFGPLLPIVAYETQEDVVNYINDRPRPLAMYVFDRNTTRTDDLLARTHSGGVSLNDCMLHIAQEDIPFGGVGDSGIGSYHGFEGFETFSHKKSVFRQSRVNFASLLNPPYGDLMDRLMAVLVR